LLLLQAPPEEVLLREVVVPAHMVVVPVIEAGALFTVMVVVLEQPVLNV
jgi:hypothetical protein